MGYLIQRQIRQNLAEHWSRLGTGDHTELMVLYTLADHANEGDAAQGATVEAPGGTRQCFPTIETITKQGVASRRQVMRALAGLRAKGYLTTAKHPKFSSNVYTVVDMVAGNALVDASRSTATMALAAAHGTTPDQAAAKLNVMVTAWETSYAAEHEGCLPTPDVLAGAINDIAAALIATHRGAPIPASGTAAPEVRLRAVS